MNIIEKIFGTYSEREIKRNKEIVDKIMGLKEEYVKLTDTELKAKTPEFKERLKTEALSDILPEAFAVVREASRRVLNLEPYEVQVAGGVILHQGRIAEMKTGEGKTLVATMPAYLNALKGEGVFIITVNEYLAKRDSEQMGKVFNFLGLSVGLIEHSMGLQRRQREYKSDIIYTTNNELGFDYLKDNMVLNADSKTQREFSFAIIDEVDSILIDEAGTPLIISGRGEDVSKGYIEANKFVKTLSGTMVKEEKATRESLMESIPERYKDFDYIIYEKEKVATLTDKGIAKAERRYNIKNLGAIENVEITHYISKALKAHAIFKRDVDYVVKDGNIVIVDEHTGRLMDGRRYSQGIHQAIETKEKVMINNENKTLATISFQNLFKRFKKISGMTGTALTERDEFIHVYGLDVVEIPTNEPVIREDKVDKVYMTTEGKIKGILKTVRACQEVGQPVLVGTVSVSASEKLSKEFKKAGIKHEVLNAKQHANEAKVIAQAGEFNSVTIATNMAGRGTDIILGGNVDFKVKSKLESLGYTAELVEESNTHYTTEDAEILEIRERYSELYEEISEKVKPWVEKVKNAGGLYVLGTERHESRRIDNQLRGRSGRQGDPGVSEFLISMEDDLLRKFGGLSVLGVLGDDTSDDVPLDIKMLSKMVLNAQKRIEGMHFSIRKNLMEYDDIINVQRELVYKQRNDFLMKDSVEDDLIELIKTFIRDTVNKNIKSHNDIRIEEYNEILKEFSTIPHLSLPKYTGVELSNITAEELIESIETGVENKRRFLNKLTDKKESDEILKRVLLFVIDDAWQDHIVVMDDFKEGVGLRAYSQQDPLVIYRTEGYEIFNNMLNYVRKEMFKVFMKRYGNAKEIVNNGASKRIKE